MFPTRFAVGDIDGGRSNPDGRPELVFATHGSILADGGMLHVLRADGQIAEGWPVSLPHGGRGVVLADLTNDGNLEIVIDTAFPAGEEGLLVFDHAANLLWAGVGWTPDAGLRRARGGS